MKSKEPGRRGILKNGATLAGMTVGGIRSASGESTSSDKLEAWPKDLHEYGERCGFETAVRTPSEVKGTSIIEAIV